MKQNAVQKYLAEVVSLGGIPLSRSDAYQHFLSDGFSTKQADSMAFGYANRVDADPWSLEEFHQFLFERHGWKPDVPETKTGKG